MRDYNHIRDRVEREIEELMTEKKWTPKHAEALEELLMTLKCLEEIEPENGHKKKNKMKKKMYYNYEDDEEDDEDEEEEKMRKRRQRQHQNYERNNYENDNYARDSRGGRDNYERRMRGNGGSRQNYSYDPPMNYHYLPWPHDDRDYMEDWDYGFGPPMNMMPPFRGGHWKNQYNQYSYPGNQYEQGHTTGHTGNESGQQ